MSQNRPEILRFFPDWYGTVHPAPPPELIEIRLKCVSAAVQQIGQRDVANLVRALLDAGHAVDFRDSMAVKFAATDKSFPAKHNTNLVSVMLMGCLAKVVDSSGILGSIAALSLKAMTLGGTLRADGIADLIEGSSLFVRDYGARLREQAHQEPGTLATIAVFEPSKLAVMQLEDIGTNQWELITKNNKAVGGALTAIHKSVTSLETAVHALTTQVAASLKTIGPRLRDPAVVALQEETQILWWLFGGWSEAAASSFRQMSLPGAALLLAAECSEMTKFVPGHPEVLALLGRAVSECPGTAEAISLVDVVSGTPRKWREQIIKLSSPSTPLTPVLLAIGRSLETAGNEWKDAFESTTGVQVTASARPLDWGQRLYDEMLLARLLANA